MIGRESKNIQEQKNGLYDKAAETLRKQFNLALRAIMYERAGFLKHFLKNIDFKKGQVWADIGAGFLQKTAKTKKALPDIKILAMDQSKKMLRKGLEKNPDFSGDVFVGDLNAIPMSINSLDGVFIFQVLHHLTEEKLRKGLQEIQRVIKNNGQVAIVETFNIQPGGLKEKWFKVIEGEYVNLSKHSLQTQDQTYFNMERKKFIEIFEEYGFKLVSQKQSEGFQGMIDNVRYMISEPLVFRVSK